MGCARSGKDKYWGQGYLKPEESDKDPEPVFKNGKYCFDGNRCRLRCQDCGNPKSKYLVIVLCKYEPVICCEDCGEAYKSKEYQVYELVPKK